MYGGDGMLNFNLGGTGTGKSYEMLKKISQSVDLGKKICILVPDQYSFEFDKKLYNSMGAKRYNNVTVLSFARLAQDIFIKYGGKSGEYANDLTKLSIMYMAINSIQKNDKLKFYNKQAKSPQFIDNALQIVKEFRWSNISPEALAEKAPFLNDNIYEKVNDISTIFTAYNDLLEENGYKDSLNDITEAAKIAEINGYFKNTTVFVDEFQSFSGDELEMLDTIISTADELNVTLTMDEVPQIKSSLFSITHDTYYSLVKIAQKYNVKISIEIQETAHRFKSMDIETVSKNIFRPVRKATDICENVKIYESPEIYTEVDFVCTEIRKLVREKGYRFNEIAVISRQLPDYTNILESAFARYEIPYFLDANKPVMHKSLMLLVMSIFEIAVQKHPNTESVLRYAKTGLLGLPYSLISALENYCYKWNVDGEMWEHEFVISENSADNFINDARMKLINPLLKFKKETKNATGEVICEALYRLFIEIDLDKNISGISAAKKADDVENLTIAREIKQLWNVLIGILEAIHTTLGETQMPLKDFRELLRIMLSESTFANPPQTLDCVTVSSAERARLADPKAVFVIGVNEGIFPLAVKSSGLFNDKDKTVLEQVGLKLSITTKHLIDEERFITYTTISAPSEKLYITYPLSDSTGKVRFPSYIIEQISKLFKSNIITKIADLPSIYFCTTEKSAYYNFVQGYNKNDEYSASLRYYLEMNENYSEKLAYLDKVNENVKLEIEDKELSKKLFGDKLIVSATRFEDFNKCHFCYFCKKGLGLYPPQRIEINAMEQGNIIHKCMFDIFKSYNKENFVNETAENLHAHVNKTLDTYYNEVLGGDFGKTARFHSTYQKLVDTIMEVLFHLQEEFSQSEFVPTDFELKISENSEIKPTKLVSKSGMEISFIGTIDRVDTYVNNGKTYVRVVDYKSGEKSFRLEDILYGINMQMLLYLFTITQGDGKYSMSEPAGVLYMPSKELEPELSRNSSDEDLTNSKDKSFKMNGILLDDEEVIRAMEKEVSGIYIPVKKAKDGYTKASSLITKKQIENLRKYAYNLLTEMADKLYDGQIDATPLTNGKITPCDYCEYWSICGNDMQKVRSYAPNSKDIIQEILNGDEEIAKQMDTSTVASD